MRLLSFVSTSALVLASLLALPPAAAEPAVQECIPVTENRDYVCVDTRARTVCYGYEYDMTCVHYGPDLLRDLVPPVQECIPVTENQDYICIDTKAQTICYGYVYNMHCIYYGPY